MRTYGQYCGVAKALDVAGDRWAMLIVRELLLRGPLRHTDLRNGLPGIATNILGDRLQDLEGSGIVERVQAAPPVPATLIQLTERGRALEPVIAALAEFGEPLLARPAKDDEMRASWLLLPARRHLKDHAPWAAPATIEVHTAGETILIAAAGGQVHVEMGTAGHPHAIISGSPQLVVGVLTGGMTLADAAAWGLSFEGDPNALRRVQPHAGDASGLQGVLFQG